MAENQLKKNTCAARWVAPVICTVAMTFMASAASAATPTTKADNTEVNARDTEDRSLTPLDQSNTSADTNIVAHVRSALTDDEKLSTNAKNIKVIVQSGVVSLRGPVNSAEEKKRVETIAKGVAGVRSVHSEIDIAH